MRFLSNFGCKMILICSVDLLHRRKHWSGDLLVQVAYTLMSSLLSLRQEKHS